MLRLHAHDPFQLELKHDIPLVGSASHALDVWVWLPGQLGIDANGFHKDDFYDDLTAYVRFHAPPLDTGALGDAKHGPLASVEAALPSLRTGDASALERATRCLRTYAAALRSDVRERTRLAMTGVTGGGSTVAARALLATNQATLEAWRGRRRAWLEGFAPDAPFAKVVLAVEDYVSMQALEAWYALHAATTDVPLREALAQAIRAETSHRVEVGHQGELRGDDVIGNERFVTRIGMLKKFVLGVLHVRLRVDKRAQHVRDLLFALAAAVAMLVALALQIWTTWTVGIPTGPGPALLAFVAAGVGGYILKDRTKEWLKGWFASALPRWLHDRRVLLLAEAGDAPTRRWQRLAGEPGLRKLGAVEETVHLLVPSEVPAVASVLRDAGEDQLTAGERANEDIVHYRRRTVLRPDEAPASMVSLDTIVRLGVHRWLRRMDDPVRALFQVQPDGEIHRIKAPRTYRVHVVARAGGEVVHAVVVLSRKGILRVDNVPAHATRSS